MTSKRSSANGSASADRSEDEVAYRWHGTSPGRTCLGAERVRDRRESLSDPAVAAGSCPGVTVRLSLKNPLTSPFPSERSSLMAAAEEISADFPFESRFVDVLGSRMHYVEEGDGTPVLFLHGNPTSSYLWRNVIPHVSKVGRCIALDLIGMGRSDKPDLDYRFFDHSRYVEAAIEALGLESIAFVAHDWGSAIAFHYARRHERNVRALAFMEAILMPIPGLEALPAEVRDLFGAFRTADVGWDLIARQNVFIEQILPGSVVRGLTEAEMENYREPFPDEASRKPVWRWPNEIPLGGEPADVVEAVNAYNEWLQRTELPKLLFYASPGAIVVGPVLDWARANLKNLETVDLGEGIHYLQEDYPHAIGRELARWLGSKG
jgi:haloalkane dehalogenase